MFNVMLCARMLVKNNVLPFCFRSLIEQVKAARRSKSALDHVSILPLATSLEREINVLQQALHVVYFPETRATPRDFVSIMQLRNAILAWEQGHRGQVC